MLVEKHQNFLLEESSAIVSCTRQQALEERSLTIFKKRKRGWVCVHQPVSNSTSTENKVFV
jgi:ketosteroid isomerase-like protein